MSRWMILSGRFEFPNLSLTNEQIDAIMTAAPIPHGSEGDLEWIIGNMESGEPCANINDSNHLRDSGWQEDVDEVEVWARAVMASTEVIEAWVEVHTMGRFVMGLYYRPGEDVIKIAIPPEFAEFLKS